MAKKTYVYNGTEWTEITSAAAVQTAATNVPGIVQLTDSVSSTSITTAATPNSVKSAYDLAAGAISKGTLTTAGDIIYASDSSTPARLGVGTTGQVLSVSAGVPAWTTPSAGGLTLIATANPSAATSVLFSSIPSTYKKLIIEWKNVNHSTTSGYFNVRLNNDSTSSYSWISTSSNGPGNSSRSVSGSVGKVTTFGGTNNYTAVIGSTGSTSTDFSLKAYGKMIINDYSSDSTSKAMESISYSANGLAIYVNFLGGMYDKTDVITSVEFIRSASETINGTFYLYGVS